MKKTNSDIFFNETDTKQLKEDDYPLIPIEEIDDEARKIAVSWHEAATGWIGDKHKLASDIMNYAKKQVRKALTKTQ